MQKAEIQYWEALATKNDLVDHFRTTQLTHAEINRLAPLISDYLCGRDALERKQGDGLHQQFADICYELDIAIQSSRKECQRKIQEMNDANIR